MIKQFSTDPLGSKIHLFSQEKIKEKKQYMLKWQIMVNVGRSKTKNKRIHNTSFSQKEIHKEGIYS